MPKYMGNEVLVTKIQVFIFRCLTQHVVHQGTSRYLFQLLGVLCSCNFRLVYVDATSSLPMLTPDNDSPTRFPSGRCAGMHWHNPSMLSSNCGDVVTVSLLCQHRSSSLILTRCFCRSTRDQISHSVQVGFRSWYSLQIDL